MAAPVRNIFDTTSYTAFLSWGKLWRREADHLPASGVEGKNHWSHILLSLYAPLTSSEETKFMHKLDYDINMNFEVNSGFMD
jgi:hypothetical protein